MRNAPRIRFLEDPTGARVAYAVSGSGPVLVLPAWWVSHVEHDWEQPGFRAFFEHLGEVATVVRYDRPGVGLSDPCEDERGLEDEVALLDAVIGVLEAPVVSLLGVSCGGPPAIRWAADHPDRVDHLILFGAYARGEDIAPAELRDALCGLVRAHWGAGARALADVFIPDATSAERAAFTQAQRVSADAAAAERYLRLTYAMDVTEDLPRVKARTHVFHRRDDRSIPFVAGRGLASEIPGAELVVLDGRTHLMWMGDDTARPIADVLRGRAPTVAAAPCRLDEANRSVVIDGQPTPLTPLELGVLRHLLRHAGRVVTREELIERVWAQHSAGSNVVDAVMRTLRKKLGPYAGSVQTVTGHGYRFETWQP